jgi:8-oxo-dGTP pyrophosphatase MutT (NUDIX family)
MRVRRTSRLIVLDEDSRVLLFKTEDATVNRPNELSPSVYWLTPGGSLETGETHDDAARRELWEETGIVVDTPGPWVAICEPVLDWAGEPVQAHDRFYLIRPRTTAVTLEHMTNQERTVYRGHRWWNVEELRASGEPVIPSGLVNLLAQIVAGDVPTAPVRMR